MCKGDQFPNVDKASNPENCLNIGAIIQLSKIHGLGKQAQKLLLPLNLKHGSGNHTLRPCKY